MLNRHWLTSDWQQRKQRNASKRLQTPKTQPPSVRWLCAAMLLAAAPLLSGCPGPLIRPCETLPLPKPPALTEQLPSVSYSKQAQTNIEAWQKQLTDTPAMSKP